MNFDPGCVAHLAHTHFLLTVERKDFFTVRRALVAEQVPARPTVMPPSEPREVLLAVHAVADKVVRDPGNWHFLRNVFLVHRRLLFFR